MTTPVKGLWDTLLELRDQSQDSFPDDTSKREGYLEALSDMMKEVAASLEKHKGQDFVQVFRLYEFTGPRSLVEKQLEMSVRGTKVFGNGVTVKAATLGNYPTILEPASD